MRTSSGPDRQRGRASLISALRTLRAARHALAGLVLGGLIGCAGGTRVLLGDATPPLPGPTATLVENGRLRLPGAEGVFAPTVLGVDAMGRLYVTDSARGRIAVFDREIFSGFLEAPSASTGSAARFGDVRGIASATGGLTVYVLDGTRGRLYGYDLALRYRGIALDLSDPTVVARFGRIDAGGVAFDPSGRAIISDREGDRLLVFDPQWRPDSEIGGPGPAGRGFFDPGALVSGRGGELGVSDPGNRTVQVIESSGRFGPALPLPQGAESLTPAGPGRFLVGGGAGDVHLVEAAGARLVLSAPPGVGGPAWVVRNAGGDRLYVASPGAEFVTVYAWNDSLSMP